MHMGLDTGLAVPAEGSVRKINMNPEALIERLPYPGYLFACVMLLVDTSAVRIFVPCMSCDAFQYQPET